MDIVLKLLQRNQSLNQPQPLKKFHQLANLTRCCGHSETRRIRLKSLYWLISDSFLPQTMHLGTILLVTNKTDSCSCFELLSVAWTCLNFFNQNFERNFFLAVLTKRDLLARLIISL